MDVDPVPAHRSTPGWPVYVLDGGVGLRATGIAVHIQLPSGSRPLVSIIDFLTRRFNAVEIEVIDVVPQQGNLDVARLASRLV
jgi:hypothetical protein